MSTDKRVVEAGREGSTEFGPPKPTFAERTTRNDPGLGLIILVVLALSIYLYFNH